MSMNPDYWEATEADYWEEMILMRQEEWDND